MKNGVNQPQSGLDILLSGMRDYQDGDGNVFVLNRIILGMSETPLYFPVDMEQYKGTGTPGIGYIMENVRRLPEVGNLIVAFSRNEKLPDQDTTVKVFPLPLEEYIPVLAERNESLLLLDPVEGWPVVIPSAWIGDLLLTIAKEELERKRKESKEKERVEKEKEEKSKDEPGKKNKMSFFKKLFGSGSANKESQQNTSYVSQEDEAVSSSKMTLIVGGSQIIPVPGNRLFICEPEAGKLDFGDQITGYTHMILEYSNRKWHLTVYDPFGDIWLSGIRVKPDQQYLLRSGDQVDMKGKVSFLVQCDPSGAPSRNRTQMLLSRLEQDIKLCSGAKKPDPVVFARIMDALLHVPLYAWGGYQQDAITGEMVSFIQPIPVKADAQWKMTPEGWDKFRLESPKPKRIPLFTSEEEAAKGGCFLSAFLHDYPLPIFKMIMEAPADIVINPFSSHPLTIPLSSVQTLWKAICEQNKLDNCPAPDWRQRRIIK